MDKKFTQTALLAGICMMLTLSGLGFIKTPLLSVTIVHVPVILGVLIVGRKQGVVLGLIFGLCSLYQNMVYPTVTSFVFLNPLVSVLPRVMIPIGMIMAGMLIRTENTGVKTFVCSIVGSLTNTVLVLSMIYVLYAGGYAQAIGVPVSGVAAALLTTAVTNGIAEAVIVSLLSLGIVKTLKKEIRI